MILYRFTAHAGRWHAFYKARKRARIWARRMVRWCDVRQHAHTPATLAYGLCLGLLAGLTLGRWIW